MENHKYQVENYKTKKLVRVPDGEHIIVKNTHEAIISEADFKTVQTVIKKGHYPAHHEHENLYMTGLFMVGHRYYNPEWGRWLTPDSVEYLDSSNINGLNLYCYCNNNPVMYFDGDGHMPQWAQWLIGCAVIAGLGVATFFTRGAAGVILGATFYGAFTGAVRSTW